MPNTRVLHPVNGTVFFGVVPHKAFSKKVIHGAPIVLKQGRHHRSSGFGVEHIWARHENDLRAFGCAEKLDVAKYVAHIIQPGSPLHCDFEHIKHERVTVVRSATGIAVLEYMSDDHGDHYSVVTAFSQRFARGTRIGTVQKYATPQAAAAAATSLAAGAGIPTVSAPAAPAANDEN